MNGNNTNVTDYLWWGDKLEVAVYSTEYGKTFRIQFHRSTDGILKISSGGGYRGVETEAFENAKDAASEWVCDELGYEVVKKSKWSRVKVTRGMDFQDKQELSKLTSEERQQLAQKLRRDEIDLSDESGDSE